jgi:probable rRNA maturation factor
MATGAARVLVDVGDFAGAPSALIEQAVRRARAAEDRGAVEISVALLGDDDIGDLNRRYLGEEGPTDVIAFALGEDEDIVGDVYIGMEQARRQAEELSVPLEEELARLAIHGVLHVLGHDHPDGPDRIESPMFALQERLLRDLLSDSATP